MKKLILTRDFSHQFLTVEGVEGHLHFPPAGDSHPTYWRADEAVLSKAYKALEIHSIPFRGDQGQVEIPDPALLNEVLDLIKDQEERQQAAWAEEQDAELEEELDRLGY